METARQLTQHTPGPWRMTEGPPGAITRQTRPGLHTVSSAPGFTVHTNQQDKWPGHEVVVAAYTYNEANARLIAAAPEMYELLAHIIEHDPLLPCGFCINEARRIKAEIDGE